MSLSAPLLANQPEFDFEVADQHPVGDLMVVDFQAREELSRLFELRLHLAAAADTEVDVPALIGKAACLTVQSAVQPRFFHGIISRMSLTHGPPEGRFPRRFEATVVPRLWTLRHSSNCRIFEGQSVPEIVKKVLGEHKVDVQLDLVGNYRQREYCVQYRESDLDFVSRLLEEEGIAYRFEHEQSKELVVLVDASASYPQLAGEPAVAFNAGGMITADEVVRSISRAVELRSGAVALRDFNFLRPAQDLTAEEESSGAEKSLQVYDYPGRYEGPQEGKALARVRLQELRSGADTVEGSGEVRRFVAGAKLSLGQHPDDSMNQPYLLLEVEHRGQQRAIVDDHGDGRGGGRERGEEEGREGPEPAYRNRFVALPASVPFRPERRTPRPEIHGAQTATVVGPSGEEISTDEHGRVKVQFHWTRGNKGHPTTSCWLRVSQAWAGAGWGALWIPRIGHEVVVEFLEGDPDRPIVVGSVYNGANPPPLPLPAQKTRSVVRSNSSPGGSGSNELRFEDAAGSEEVYLHAQKDLTVEVENDKAQTVGRDESLQVGRDRSLVVQGNHLLQVKGNDRSQVNGHQKLQVDGNRSTSVGGNDAVQVGGDHSVEVDGVLGLSVLKAFTEQVALAKSVAVGAAYQLTVGGALNEVVGAFKSEQVGGSKAETVGGDKKETVGGSRTLHVTGEMSEEVLKTRTLKVHKDLMISVGGKLNEAVKGTYSVSAKELNLVAEDTFTIKVGSATITVKKSGDIVIKGAKVELNSQGDLILKASKISEN